MRDALFVLGILSICALVSNATERHWQTGTWTDVSVTRQMVDFGPGSTPFERAPATPTMRAMADVRVYVIETETLRVELREVVQINKRTVDAVAGASVTFALDKKTVYIRDSDGAEHKFRVTKQTAKHP